MQERRARQRQADNMRQNSAARSAAGLGYTDVESPLGAETPARTSDQRGMGSIISNLGRLIEQQRGIEVE